MLVAAKSDRLDLVARLSVQVVYQVDVRRLHLEIRGYLNVKVTLALEKIDQVSATLFHKIRINSTFGKYRDQLFHLSTMQEGKPSEFRTHDPHLDARGWLGINDDIGAVRIGVIVGLIEANLARELV